MTDTAPATQTLSPIKSPGVISGMFNRIAGTYDTLNDLMSMGMHRMWKQKACALLNLAPGQSALDVCCGTGDISALLATQVGSTGKVIALDFSSEMLAVGMKRFPETSQIQWIQGDATKLPFEDNSFDAAMISFGLRNVENVSQALSEMARVIRPGGTVLNLDTASDCRNPLFWLYFSTVMPLMGKLVARDQEAYQYLFRSTKAFETPSQLVKLFEATGLTNVQSGYFSLGSVSWQRGQKPS